MCSPTSPLFYLGILSKKSTGGMFTSLLSRGLPAGSRSALQLSVSRVESKADEALHRTIIRQSQQLACEYFDTFTSCCQMIEKSKETARRSILIDHCGSKSIDLSTGFDNVDHVYSIVKPTKEGPRRFSLIEFKTQNDAELVVNRAAHKEGLLPVPLKMLQHSQIGSHTSMMSDVNNLPFEVEEAIMPSTDELSTRFSSYAEFIANNVMTLVDLKLRFVTLVNFEEILCNGPFRRYELMPFGSSVIDLGCNSGDLDLVVTLKENHEELIARALAESQELRHSNMSAQYDHNQQQSVPSSQGLVHIDKKVSNEAKDSSGIKTTMKWFDYILREFMPLTDGFGILFIKHAKVPIIKYSSHITSLDCDLSFNLSVDGIPEAPTKSNYSSIIMSQLLFSLCRQNSLFTTVANYLKVFAKSTSITSKPPASMTNFQFLSLVISYLQQTSIKSLIDDYRRSKKREVPADLLRLHEELRANAGINQTPIVPSFKELMAFKVRPMKLSKDQIEIIAPHLVRGFFDFYSDFDYRKKMLNIYISRQEPKLDYSFISVQNPMERSKNVCYNVFKPGLEHFVRVCEAARNKLDQGVCSLELLQDRIVAYKETKDNTANDYYDLRGPRMAETRSGVVRDLFRR